MTRFSVLLCAFGLSGVAGLVYQSTWSRYLAVLFGHAAQGQAIVLVLFMGGMALGSALVAQRATRWRSLIRVYAAVEAVLGVLGLLGHRLFVWLRGPDGLDGPLGSTGTAWTFALLGVAVPAVLLGATFPLLAGALVRRRPQASGAALAMAYFTNTIGAAGGALIAGFWLIPRFGLPGSLQAAAGINFVVAVAVLLAGRHAPAPLATSVAPAASARDRLTRWILVVAFASSLASFFYEVAWIRMLSLVLGSTTQSFDLMLSAFLLGLACGGLWIRRRADQLESVVATVARVQVALGLLALMTVPLYGLTFDVVAWILRSVSRTDAGYVLYQALLHAVSFAVMAPATFAAGMTLPLFVLVLLRAGRGEAAIGWVYAASTAGSIGGVLLGLYLLMPVLGVRGLVILGAGVDVLIGFLLARGVGGQDADQSGVGADRALGWRPVVAVGMIFAVTITLVPFDPRRMASAVYRNGVARLDSSAEVIFQRDGRTATVSVHRNRDGGLVLATNGKPDASMQPDELAPSGDEHTMVLLGALPLALRPDARRVANIGFGAGLTTHTLLGSPRLESLDTIEIEPAMVDAARLFGPRVHRAFEDPRSRIVFRDARNFLVDAEPGYDVIVSEPSNPWVAGVSNLFSEEFYRIVRARLAPDGVLVQWIQLYETNLGIVSSIVEALEQSFGDYRVFLANDADLVLVAAPERVGPLDPRIFETDALRRELERVKIRSPQDLALRWIADRDTMEPLVRSFDATAHSEMRPSLDTQAARSLFLGDNALGIYSLRFGALPQSELIAGEAAPAFSELATFDAEYQATRLQRRALAAFDALIGASAPEDRDDSANPAFVARSLRLEMRSCVFGGKPDGDHVRRSMRDLSVATTSALPKEQRAALWAAVANMPCFDQLDEETLQWWGFYRALALRDRPALARLGRELLATRRASDEELELVLLATATAMAGEGAGHEARNLVEENRRHIAPSLASRLLLSLLATSD